MASTNPTTATNINNNNLAANKGKDKGRGKGKKGKKPAAPSDAPVSTLPNAASTSTVPDGAKRKADATLEREENKKLKDFIAKGGPELAAFTKLKGVEMPNLTDKNDGDGDATALYLKQQSASKFQTCGLGGVQGLSYISPRPSLE